MGYERPETLLDLVEAFNRSPDALSAATETKRFRRRAFNRFLKHFGAKTSLSFIEDRGARTRLYDWRDSFAATPAEGNATLTAVGMLFNWAVDRGYTRDNPAAAIKQLGPRRRSRAEHIWQPEQILQFLDAAERPLRELLLLSLWTGLRESDLFLLTADHCRQGWLTITPKKTSKSSGIVVSIPYFMNPTIAPLLVQLSTLQWKAGAPMLRTPTGLPWRQQTLNHHWQRAMERAGLKGSSLRFHDLRGTFVTRLLEANCTNAEVSSLTGHAIGGGSIGNYAARTRAIASNAYEKLIKHAGENYADARRKFFGIAD